MVKTYKKNSTIVEFHDDYYKDIKESEEILHKISKKIITYLNLQERGKLRDEND